MSEGASIMPMSLNIEGINNWRIAFEHSVGGFEYIGFSKNQSGKMICISSQCISLIDCNSNEKIECDAEYDEKEFIAICGKLDNEVIPICGIGGGELSHSTSQGDSVILKTITDENGWQKTRLSFNSSNGENKEIYNNYGYYACGFSDDGNYFAFVDDLGITVMNRT